MACNERWHVHDECFDFSNCRRICLLNGQANGWTDGRMSMSLFCILIYQRLATSKERERSQSAATAHGSTSLTAPLLFLCAISAPELIKMTQTFRVTVGRPGLLLHEQMRDRMCTHIQNELVYQRRSGQQMKDSGKWEAANCNCKAYKLSKNSLESNLSQAMSCC